MIPLPYAKLIGAGIATLAIFYGCYRLYDAGRDSVQVRWDAEKAVQQAALRAATEATERVENERRKATQEKDDAIVAKLKADTIARDARSTVERLRKYYAGLAAVPQVSRGTPDSPGPSRERANESAVTDGVGEALNDHLAACDRDGIRLLGWQEWYELMRDSVK